MQRSTTLYIIAGSIVLVAAGVGVYLLRQRSLEGLQPSDSLINSATQSKNGNLQKNIETPTSTVFIPTATGTTRSAQDLEVFKYAKMQYTDEEQGEVSAVIQADQRVPEDITQTWTPEFRAQLEAQQKNRK